jgi:tetratricopeptide (TPR) repeat protein
MNRREIEARLEEMGDFVKMDFLTRCLKDKLDFDTRRFAFLKLADLYEQRGMFLEAGRMLQNAAPINPSDSGKINDYLGSAGHFVKSGDYDRANIIFDRALNLGNNSQKIKIKEKRIELYRLQADILIMKDKRHNAMVICERILDFDLPEGEKRIVQGKLLELYERLGKIREFYNLKKLM